MSLAIVLGVAPAWAINKCKGPDGQITYQAQPCAGGSGQVIRVQSAPSAVTAAPDKAVTASGQSPEQRALAGMEKDRRIREVTHEIADIEQRIEARNQQMNREMEILKQRKSRANNNLAGATWEQSLSTEMQAVATKYKAMNDVDFEKIKALRTTLASLQSGK